MLVLLENTRNFLPGSLFSVYKDSEHQELHVTAEDSPSLKGGAGARLDVGRVLWLTTSADTNLVLGSDPLLDLGIAS